MSECTVRWEHFYLSSCDCLFVRQFNIKYWSLYTIMSHYNSFLCNIYIEVYFCTWLESCTPCVLSWVVVRWITCHSVTDLCPAITAVTWLFLHVWDLVLADCLLHCVLVQGSTNLILEGRCPAKFSSNLPHHTCLEVSSIPKSLISCFRCVWLGLGLNSAGHRPSRTELVDPCSSGFQLISSPPPPLVQENIQRPF